VHLTEMVRRVLRKPVVDRTGIEGKFDLSLQYEEGHPESLLEILRELGFGIEAAKLTTEFLVLSKKKLHILHDFTDDAAALRARLEKATLELSTASVADNTRSVLGLQTDGGRPTGELHAGFLHARGSRQQVAQAEGAGEAFGTKRAASRRVPGGVEPGAGEVDGRDVTDGALPSNRVIGDSADGGVQMDALG
jgi:hypothetical protein